MLALNWLITKGQSPERGDPVVVWCLLSAVSCTVAICTTQIKEKNLPSTE
jgi:hypothetical protein